MILIFSTFCSKSGNNSESFFENLQPYPENPHYLAWGDVPVFLLGPTDFHSWTPISRPENVDYVAMMDRLKEIIDQTGSPHVKGFMRAVSYDPMNHLHDGYVQRFAALVAAC